MCVHLSSFWSHLAFFLVTIVDLTLLLYFTHHYIASAVRVLFLPRIRVDAVPKFKFKLRPLAGNALMWCFKISEIFTCMCVCIKNTLKIFWISRRLYRCASSGASVDQGILTLEWHRDQIRSHMITTLFDALTAFSHLLTHMQIPSGHLKRLFMIYNQLYAYLR